MAAKRQATTNLNHNNWDQEDETEERGTFKTASEEELKTRVIRKATRRKVLGTGSGDAADETDVPAKSVFGNFTAFGKPATSSTVNAAAASPFAFLSKLAAPAASAAPTATKFSFGATETATATTTSAFESSAVTTAKSTSSASSIFGSTAFADPAEEKSKEESTPAGYGEDMASLNKSVMKFLQEQMEKHAYWELSPVFASYENHLKAIKAKYSIKPSSSKAATTSPIEIAAAPAPAATTAAASFSFGKPSTPATSSPSIFDKKTNATVTSSATTMTPPLFSFGNAAKSPPSSTVNSEAAAPSSIGSFSFGVKSQTAGASDAVPKAGFFSSGNTDNKLAQPKTNGFSFGLKSSEDKPGSSMFGGFGKASGESSGFSFSTPGAAPFSFNVKPPTQAAIDAANAEAAEDEEDKPPKVEFKQVVEDDAIYSKRCKVYVKKDKDFGDRGVGTLYLKPVKDTTKTQMLVRADTNLGNILINLILSEGLPCQRMGKNNVMMVCIPTPEESKATSILLRVKTGEEADDLLEQIKKHSAHS